ncbi:MAG: discoidin domain-containing protein, partial [Clostridia bacterium]|nr:discoidin domain-containing protein [Clostridia bacterium]
MKKFLAVLLAAILVVPAAFMLISADEPVNVAEGKSYERSLLYRQGGAEVEWNWSDSADIAYPDEDNKSLTDGVVAGDASAYGDVEWAGFHAKCPDYVENGYSYITVDLGAAYDLTKIAAYTGTKGLGESAGITAPTSVEFLVSDDGENFTSVESVVPANAADKNCEEVATTVAASGRYVQVRIAGKGWLFISEVMAFGTEKSEVAPEPAKTYENTYRVEVDENGAQTAVVDVPYGYTWTINYVNGSCAGEDATICT